MQKTSGRRSRRKAPSRTILLTRRSSWSSCAPAGATPSCQSTLRTEAPNYAKRRAALSAAFPGETIVIPSGREMVRANDTNFPFRPGSDFVYLTGEHDPESVLVLRPERLGPRRGAVRARRARRATPTSSSRTAATASCGSAAGTRCARSPPSWASRPPTWTTSPSARRPRARPHPRAARPRPARRRRWSAQTSPDARPRSWPGPSPR